MQDKKVLREQLNNIKTKIEEIYDTCLTLDANDELKMDSLYAEYYKIRDYLIMMDCSLIIGNDIVDLYKENNTNIEGKYIICLRDTKTIVGNVDYRPGNFFIGNIGYEIKEQFRGNNYAYHATYLLLQILCLNGINQANISAKINNIASIKTLNKLKECGLDCNIIEDKNENIIRYHYQFNKEMFINNQVNQK